MVHVAVGDMVISAARLVEIFELSPRRVRQLAEEGVFVRATRGQYFASRSVQNYAALIERRAAQASEPSSATRLMDRKTQRLELAIAREERKLIHIDEAQAGMEEVWAAVHSEVGAIGRQVAAEVGKNRADRQRIHAIVKQDRSRLEQRFVKAREKLRTGRTND